MVNEDAEKASEKSGGNEMTRMADLMRRAAHGIFSWWPLTLVGVRHSSSSPTLEWTNLEVSPETQSQQNTMIDERRPKRVAMAFCCLLAFYAFLKSSFGRYFGDTAMFRNLVERWEVPTILVNSCEQSMENKKEDISAISQIDFWKARAITLIFVVWFRLIWANSGFGKIFRENCLLHQKMRHRSCWGKVEHNWIKLASSSWLSCFTLN